MGLHSSIKQLLEQNFPQCFKATIPAGRRVVFDDALTRLKFMKGRDPMLTIAEMADSVFGGEVRNQIFNNPEVHAYIICIDDDSNKPHKGKEMLKRYMASVAQAKKEGKEFDYPPGCSLSLKGVIKPDGTIEPKVDVNRLFNTRYLRRLLWAIVLDEMKKIVWPKGKKVIFEFDQTGPWVFEGSKAIKRIDLAHNHGEADLSALFWMSEFPRSVYLVKTVDSDFIALSNIYLSSYKDSELEPDHMFWICTQRLKTGTTIQTIDMKKLKVEIENKFDLKRFDLLLALILNETDFYKKKDTTHNIGSSFILTAVAHMRYYLRHQFQWHVFEMKQEEAVDVLKRFLRIVYQIKLDNKRLEWNPVLQTKEREISNFDKRWPVLERVRETALNQEVPMQFPTDEKINESATDLCINFNYWTQWWRHFGPRSNEGQEDEEQPGLSNTDEADDSNSLQDEPGSVTEPVKKRAREEDNVQEKKAKVQE